MFHRITLAAFHFVCVFGAQANATCTEELVEIMPDHYSSSDVEGRKVRASITNLSDHAIGGAVISFDIWSLDRPLPLGRGLFRDSIEIPGGLMPGETFQALDYHFMKEREVGLAHEASRLEIRVLLESVADVHLRPAGSSGMNVHYRSPRSTVLCADD